MGSQWPKLFHANIVDSNWTVIGVNVIILEFRAPAHMLQLLSNSLTLFLFDALKQTESMLNVPNEWVMENVCCHIT